MGAYKYITQTLQKQYKERDAVFRAKVIAWRAAPAIERMERPSNITRARRLGYQAKQGYIVVRARVDKGRRTRRKTMGGRKHKNNYRFVQPQLSHQAIAEQRVNRIYKNMEVLNSYWVGEDGNYKFYEVILADASMPTVNISSVIRQGKAFRGLTSAGNSRGPSKKKGLNKKLQRKLLARKPFHYEPYVKVEGAAEPKARLRTAKQAKKPAPNAIAMKAAAGVKAQQKSDAKQVAAGKPAASAQGHETHKPGHHTESKPAQPQTKAAESPKTTAHHEHKK
jgi:large subunit ribosomal protein L15e